MHSKSRSVVPTSTFAEIRVEEGIFHAGALEAGEALVGWSPRNELVLWIGRTDVPVTLDRIREPEDDALSIRPVVSRISIAPARRWRGHGFGLV